MPDDPKTPPASTADDEGSDTAGAVVESAAEIAIGAVIAPFTGGETVPMVETMVETFEAGVDRLTHLRSRDESAIEDDGLPEGGGSSPGDDGSE